MPDDHRAFDAEGIEYGGDVTRERFHQVRSGAAARRTEPAQIDSHHARRRRQQRGLGVPGLLRKRKTVEHDDRHAGTVIEHIEFAIVDRHTHAAAFARTSRRPASEP